MNIMPNLDDFLKLAIRDYLISLGVNKKDIDSKNIKIINYYSNSKGKVEAKISFDRP